MAPVHESILRLWICDKSRMYLLRPDRRHDSLSPYIVHSRGSHFRLNI
jgi:hypothetical protein